MKTTSKFDKMTKEELLLRSQLRTLERKRQLAKPDVTFGIPDYGSPKTTNHDRNND